MNMQISLLAYNLHTCVVQRLRFNLISISFSYYYQRKNTLKYINLTKYSPPPVQIIYYTNIKWTIQYNGNTAYKESFQEKQS